MQLKSIPINIPIIIKFTNSIKSINVNILILLFLAHGFILKGITTKQFNFLLERGGHLTNNFIAIIVGFIICDISFVYVRDETTSKKRI